jgi:hypothetical protein
MARFGRRATPTALAPCGGPHAARQAQLTRMRTCAISRTRRRGRLYRLSPADKEWKERGLGMAKILKHKVTGVTRIIMREEKTLKLRLNHLLSSEVRVCSRRSRLGTDSRGDVCARSPRR